MKLSAEIWTSIIASASVVLGWFLNEITQLFRSRGETRRIKKRVLHDLLEINFILSRLDMSDLVDEYLKYVKTKFPQEALYDQLKPVIQDQMEKMIFQTVIDTVLDELDEIEKTYNDAIIELSKIRPIRAYYLRGVSKTLDKLEQYQDYVSEISTEITAEAPEMNPLVLDLISSIKQEQFKENIENIRKEIKSMAFSIGIKTWYQSRAVIKKKSILLDEKTKHTLDTFIDNLKNKIQNL